MFLDTKAHYTGSTRSPDTTGGEAIVPFATLTSFRVYEDIPNGLLSEIEEVIALARRFSREVLSPRYLEVDYQTHVDHTYLPRDLVEKANRWGLYTLWLPKIVGGKGLNPASLPFFCEEISSTCVTMANLIGAHYLGMVGLTLSIDYHLSLRIARDIVAGEKNNFPTLCSFAITEPDAGTDSQNIELMDRGRLRCHAKKVHGGYRINGVKVFISNGHLSTWHIVFGYSDLKKPSQSLVVFAVKTGTEGFQITRQENKMGQRGCPASELVFTDCFIPEEQICFDSSWLPDKTRKTATDESSGFSAAQGNIGAFSAGVARGAFQDAITFASNTRVNGKRLIDQEWVQCHLSNMYQNASVAHMVFIESIFSILHTGIPKKYFYFNKYFPHLIVKKLLLPFFSESISRRLRNFIVTSLDSGKPKQERIDRYNQVGGMGSLAKVTASDLAVRNCQMALQLTGKAGLRHSNGIEKRLRDSRLLQIYEGTNQINRLNVFKQLIAPYVSDVKIFAD